MKGRLMKTQLISILTLLVLTANPCLFAQDDNQTLSNTMSASYMITITFDKSFRNIPDMQKLIRSSAVLGEASTKTLSPEIPLMIANAITKIDHNMKQITKNTSAIYLQLSADILELNVQPGQRGFRWLSPDDMQDEENAKSAITLKPAAKEYLLAVIDNLKSIMFRSYEDYVRDLDVQIMIKEELLEDTHAELDALLGVQKKTPKEQDTDESQEANSALHERLKTRISLESLDEEMPLQDALNIMAGSVEPRLPLFINWTALSENAYIERDTPINFSGEGLTNVTIKKALEILIQSINANGFSEVGYGIDQDVITITTVDIDDMSGFYCGMNTSTDLLLLPIDPGALTIQLEQDPDRLKHDVDRLTQDRQDFDMSIAEVQARHKAISEQLDRTQAIIEIRTQEDEVTRELQNILEINYSKLKLAEVQVKAGQAAESILAEMKEQIARSRIDLARRREEIAVNHGANQLNEYNRLIADLSIKLAELEAGREAIDGQLQSTTDRYHSYLALKDKARQYRTLTDRIEDLKSEIRKLNDIRQSIVPLTFAIIE
jgi:hypothetical protein